MRERDPRPAIFSAIDEALSYFDNREDADHDETGFLPNEEMRLKQTLTEARSLLAEWVREPERTPTPSLSHGSFSIPPITSPLRSDPLYWVAMNNIYSHRCRILTYLALDKWAVYDASRTLRAILPSSTPISTIAEQCPEYTSPKPLTTLRQISGPTAVPPRLKDVKFDL